MEYGSVRQLRSDSVFFVVLSLSHTHWSALGLLFAFPIAIELRRCYMKRVRFFFTLLVALLNSKSDLFSLIFVPGRFFYKVVIFLE